MPPTSHARRSAIRILVAGAVVILAVLAGGWLLERNQLGTSDEEAFVRLERQVRRHVDRSVGSLKTMAATVGARPDSLAAAAEDQGAARGLFDIVDGAWHAAGSGADLAITVYGPTGEPLAWTGRPSELNRWQIVGDRPTLFPAPEALGLRLVYVLPVFDKTQRRAGTVVTEQLLSSRRGIVTATGDLYTLETSRGSVSLRTRSEGAGEGRRPFSFQLRAPDGSVMLEASVDRAQLRQARSAWRNATLAIVLLVAALTLLFLIGPLLTLRVLKRERAGYVAATAGVLVALVGAWLLAVAAGHALSGQAATFSPIGSGIDATPGRHVASPFLQSPFDFLLGGLLLVALVALAFDTSERWRLRRHRKRRVLSGLSGVVGPLSVDFVLGACFAALLGGYQLFLRGVLEPSGIDILHFSVTPWDGAQLAVAVGLLLGHTAVLWLGILLFRIAGMRWLRPRDVASHLVPIATWLAAFVTVALVARAVGTPLPWQAGAVAFVAVVVAAAVSRHVVPQFRHASQGLRLVLGLLALLLPAVVMYPTLAQFAEQANRRLIETEFAPEVMNQREAIKAHVANSLDEIDAIPGLADVVEAASGQAGSASAETAFWIWSKTSLARHRVASAVEIYRADGTLVSRFALYLPEYKSSAAQPTREQNCSWDLYEYVSPFGAEQRKLLRAGRALCVAGGHGQPVVVGSIVIHAMLDYSALPFLSSQSPYYELLRPAELRQRRNVPGGDLDLTVYGWSRTPIYTSATAWPLDTAVFSRVYRSRQPFWTRIQAGGATYRVYFMNDRGGIYALGYPQVPLTGHLVNIAEMTTLVGLTYLVMIAGSMLFTALSGHGAMSGRALLREIRASFYRKLFLAFVAVAVVPVITLAWIAQAYIGGRLRADTEAAAVKTTSVAQRVIEDWGTLQQQVATPRENTVVDPLGTMYGDDVMVALGRVIDQDVNLFVGPRLMATSERDLFESQLLPTRTPSDVYRAIALDRQQSFVGQERTGEFTYMLAASPVRVGGRDAILTVPLMLRQHEIEREIDDLNRRVVLATLLFILIGAAIGYPMAERIADPVNRLTRATRRIARGELDARIAATSSDELRRLVEAFNSMAADLQRQRVQLERTNRLEAWAEMARQVAHEIKNPLTPIQLSAEHLQRVHSDKGRPLSPVLDDCVASILAQVRLLRQISGEFSSFASSPTARPAAINVGELVEEVVGPYRSGLWGRIELHEDVPASLPQVFVDRVLVGRALANVVENALHAMPGQGSLSVAAREARAGAGRYVELAVTDTGVGMDEQARARLFEPYFSTKAIGTGLGLAIAKRNIELNGGAIEVESEKGKGTTVTLRLPVAEQPKAVSPVA